MPKTAKVKGPDGRHLSEVTIDIHENEIYINGTGPEVKESEV